MQITFSNNIRITDPPTKLKLAIIGDLTFENPEYKLRKAKKRPTWGVSRTMEVHTWDRGNLVVPRGYLPDLVKHLKELGIDPLIIERDQVFHTGGYYPEAWAWNPEIVLRDYQEEAVRAALKKGNGIIDFSAGGGKTITGVNIASRMRQPTIWFTHTKDLAEQTIKNVKRLLPGLADRVGYIGEGAWNPKGVFDVVLVQSLAGKDLSTIERAYGLGIADEVHHLPADMFNDPISRFHFAKFIGLTATQQRKDRLEFVMKYGVGPEIYKVQRSKLVDEGHLIVPEVRFVYTKYGNDPVDETDDEIGNVDAGGQELRYDEIIKDLCADDERANLIAQTILDNAANRQSFVMTENIRYLYKLRDTCEKKALAMWGVVPRMAVIHGPISRYRTDARKRKIEVYTEEEFAAWQISRERRREILAEADAGKIDILFCTQLLREGVDLPKFSGLHLATPLKGDTEKAREDGAALEQALGRVSRPAPGKTGAVVWDYVDHNIGIFRAQYMTRRRTYKRLGISLPKKPKTERARIEDLLGNMDFGVGPFKK